MNSETNTYAGGGVMFEELAGLAGAYPVPRRGVWPLVIAGLLLGTLGDALMRVPPPVGLNLSVWIASVAIAALVLHRVAGLTLDRERVAWLMIGVLFAAFLSWRDAPRLKFLAVGSVVLTFALAAHRLSAAWVRGAGVVRYAVAVVLGAVHAWTAAVLAIVDVRRFSPRVRTPGARWGTASAVVRGLAIAAPLIAVFGSLFVAADPAFEQLVVSAFRFDFERIASHILLFSIFAWISTGYLRGFLTGTNHRTDAQPIEGEHTPATNWVLGTTEMSTALAAVDLLFLTFVLVQVRYLFGTDALVQITPGLTYADYARHGFFELVVAVVLVVPMLLVADWALDRRTRRHVAVFRVLAGAQIALVLVIAVSALQRLRLYHASYGLTESRFYAMVLLFWIGAMLLWFAATVLRGRRDLFAFGTLASGLMTIAMLFVVNPDALIARANLSRMLTADARVRFDVAYATSLSADAVPVLIDALGVLPADVQCPIARHMLRRWPPERSRSLRSWNWSAARAGTTVREREAWLRSMVGPGLSCTGP